MAKDNLQVTSYSKTMRESVGLSMIYSTLRLSSSGKMKGEEGQGGQKSNNKNTVHEPE